MVSLSEAGCSLGTLKLWLDQPWPPHRHSALDAGLYYKGARMFLGGILMSLPAGDGTALSVCLFRGLCHVVLPRGKPCGRTVAGACRDWAALFKWPPAWCWSLWAGAACLPKCGPVSSGESGQAVLQLFVLCTYFIRAMKNKKAFSSVRNVTI